MGYFEDWLKSEAKVVTLVEIELPSETLYLSNIIYVTLPTDTPPNQVYKAIIQGGVEFSESLSLNGNASIGVGDIEVNNQDGSLDHWFNEVFENSKVKIYIGDVSWTRDKFVMVFSGVINKLLSRSTDVINIVLRNQLDRLNTPVTDELVNAGTNNNDRVAPLLFGECHNIEPLLIDEATEKYLISKSEIERIIEVRDNGVPITVTPSLIDGTFRLTAQAAGAITVSAQGVKPYANDAASLIKLLATQYGNVQERFALAEIDESNFNSFSASNPQPMGIYLDSKSNVLQVCQELASSISAQVCTSRTGLLRLVKIDFTKPSKMQVKPHNYLFRSLQMRDRTDVIAGVKIGYCKNWTTQTALDTGIPAYHKTLYGQEWLTRVQRDSAVATTYKLYAEPEQEDTLLLVGTDAENEALYRLNLWKVPRTIYSFTGNQELMLLDLGDTIDLYGDRYGLDVGAKAVVISIKTNWFSKQVQVEVMV